MRRTHPNPLLRDGTHMGNDESVYTFDVQVLKNLRRGDVVWVHVGPTKNTSETDVFLEALREAVIGELDEEVAVIITPSDIVRRVTVMTLSELFLLRDQVDIMIANKSEAMPAAEG